MQAKGGDNILDASGITISYGKTKVLENTGIKIESGQSVAVLGRNGCGKSSLLKALSGVCTIEKGEILLNQKSVYSKAAQKDIGYVPQNDIVFDDLSVMDNLVFWGACYGISKKREILKSEVIEVLKIKDFISKKAKQLSGGMKKRLCIAASILHNPETIIMDEPFTGIDIVAKQELIDYLKILKGAGKTFVITSHNAYDLKALCNEFYFISNGVIRRINDFSKFSEGDSLEENVAKIIIRSS